MTTAANRFLDAVLASWDSLEPWEATAAKGLAEADEDALQAFCDEAGEDYQVAEAEVLTCVRAHIAAA